MIQIMDRKLITKCSPNSEIYYTFITANILIDHGVVMAGIFIPV